MSGIIKAPRLSTEFSQSGKQVKKRFENIFWGHTKKKGTASLLAVIIVTAAAGTLVACDCASVGVIGGADGPSAVFVTKRDEEKSLCQNLYDARCKYIGNASGVGKILGLLPPVGGAQPCGMQLQTTEEPYGLIRWFDGYFSNEEELKRQASIILALIENAGYVSYSTDKGETVVKSYSREELAVEYSKSYEEFESVYHRLYADKKAMTDDELVSYAILSRNSGRYLDGECMGEGHIILGNEAGENGARTIYALTTTGFYGFENDCFIKVSGSGVIPARITFDSDNNVTEYLMPQDGSLYKESIEEIFPKKYHGKILYGDYKEQYADCLEQEKRYAAEYLKKIGRNAVICEYGDIEHEIPDLNAEVSNMMLDSFTEYPYWLGTQERIIDGVRYVYKMSMDGDNTVIFEKYLYDTGETVNKTVLNIENGEVKAVFGKIPPGKE
ncbi:MAG: DUF4825 domain-containing protein [Clostridia bacterium]|nr:DUF4825 domain-containing protein [Clostridia bacterium]